jgi:hypothetical protein
MLSAVFPHDTRNRSRLTAFFETSSTPLIRIPLLSSRSLGDHGMDHKGDHGCNSDLETSSNVWIYSKCPAPSCQSSTPSSLITFLTLVSISVLDWVLFSSPWNIFSKHTRLGTVPSQISTLDQQPTVVGSRCRFLEIHTFNTVPSLGSLVQHKTFSGAPAPCRSVQTDLILTLSLLGLSVPFRNVVPELFWRDRPGIESGICVL